MSAPTLASHARVAARVTDRFRRDERGAALLLATVFMLTLFSVVAVAIDFGQAMVLKQKLHNAADAAVLAVGSGSTSRKRKPTRWPTASSGPTIRIWLWGR